jgi:hypothetical protein
MFRRSCKMERLKEQRPSKRKKKRLLFSLEARIRGKVERKIKIRMLLCRKSSILIYRLSISLGS